jgi:hypothetical protein
MVVDVVNERIRVASRPRSSAVSFEATEGTEVTGFTEFAFSTGIFRMYRIGERSGKWNGQGSEG